MFYEEKVIDGVLHFRSTPSSDFKKMSGLVLTNKLVSAREESKENAKRLRSIYLMLDAHPDNLPDSEFSDQPEVSQ